LNQEYLLVNEIIDGNKDVYDQIIERYKDRLYAATLRIIGDEEKAEMLVEKGLKEAYSNLGTFKETQLFSDWLYKQFIHLFNDHVKMLPSDSLDYLSFHNPHYIKLEEAVQKLQPQAKLEFLCISILRINADQLANILKSDVAEVEKNYTDSLEKIRNLTLEHGENAGTGECFSLQELVEFHNQECMESEVVSINEHLEFCPDCREILQGIKKEEAALVTVLESPRLTEEFNEKILNDLSAFEKKVPKHRTWKYQFGALGIIAAIFLFSVFILPSLKPLANKVSTYLEHGTIYNVWSEGTYVAADNDISFEVTGIDIDSLFMTVYYDVKKEGESSSYPSDYEDIDFYQQNVVTIMDAEGKTYPVQAAPASHMTFGVRPETTVGKDKRPSFIVKFEDSKALPHTFTMNIRIGRLKGYYGSWKLEIPINYDKVDDTLNTVVLNEKVELEDKITLELEEISYGKNGGKLTYFVNQTEKEKQRIEKLLKEHDQEYRLEEFLDNVHVGVIVVNEEGDYMVPIFFPMMNMPNPNEPQELYFSTYYMDMELYEVKGQMEDMSGKFYAQIMGEHYQEPAFVSFEIPLEETDSMPLDVEVEGIHLQELTIKEKNNGYELIITANRQENESFRKELGWEITDTKGQHIPTEGWYHHDPQEGEGPVKVFHVDIRPVHSKLDRIVVKADYAYTNNTDYSEMKFPLYQEKEEN
jgi:DNA-directed RNA polymerase specialized sigma24 family protein/PAS domain-containing protein